MKSRSLSNGLNKSRQTRILRKLTTITSKVDRRSQFSLQILLVPSNVTSTEIDHFRTTLNSILFGNVSYQIRFSVT